MGRINRDDEFAAEQFGERDLSMKRFGMGMGMAKTDESRLFLIGQQLQGDRARLQGFRNRESSAAPGVERDNIAKSRLDFEIQIVALAKQEEEIKLRMGRESLALSRERATSEAGIAREAADAQFGVAKTLSGQVRSDSARLGAMDPLQLMRVRSAAMAFRSGRATLEEEQSLEGLNAFRDPVDAARAKRGQSTLSMIAPGFVADARTAAAEFQNRTKQAADAELHVVHEQKLLIEFNEKAGFRQDAERHVVEFIEKLFDKRVRADKQQIEDMKREQNMGLRAREVIAKR